MEFKVAQALTQQIVENTKNWTVKIPYVDDIIWPFKDKRWLFPHLKSFIAVITKIHYKQRQIKDDTIVSTVEDFETAKELWAANLEQIIYRVSATAKRILDTLPTNVELAKTRADIATEFIYSTIHAGRLLEELVDAEVANSRKSGREYIYWRSEIPGIDDIRIGHYDTGFASSKKNKTKNDAGETDVNMSISQDVRENVLTCSSCINYNKDTCVHENASLITPTATYAVNCNNYRAKEVSGDDNHLEIIVPELEKVTSEL